jgi:hypothetical protein
MLYHWLFFFFIAFGSKVVLAMAMIYMLLPLDRSCSRCDSDTLLIRPNRLGRIASALSFGRVQWRWCPSCGQENLARRAPPPREPRARVVERTPTNQR